MPRLLIAGFGYVGKATGDLFAANGWEVEGWARTRTTALRIRTSIVDVAAAETMPRDRQFDVVIHCASTRGGDAADYRHTYLDGARNLAKHFPGALLLFASSTSVYAQRDGEWVDEQSVAGPTRETAKILRETEEAVLNHGGIVARLAGIHGPGRSFMLRSFLEGTARLGGERFVNQVHRDDIAAAFLFLASNTAAREGARIFNVTDNEPMLRNDCYRWLAEKFERELPPAETAGAPRKRGDSNKRVSNVLLRSAGWAPRYPSFVVAMENSIIPALPAQGA